MSIKKQTIAYDIISIRADCKMQKDLQIAGFYLWLLDHFFPFSEEKKSIDFSPALYYLSLYCQLEASRIADILLVKYMSKTVFTQESRSHFLA